MPWWHGAEVNTSASVTKDPGSNPGESGEPLWLSR
jgi:hypothetical protein